MGLVNIAKLRAASRMRKMAGHTIARQGAGTDGYMRKYMHRASGGRCVEDMGAVEGKAAPSRMDRPARKWGGRTHMKPKMDDHDEDDKYAKGGRIKRADGGPSPFAPPANWKRGDPMPQGPRPSSTEPSPWAPPDNWKPGDPGPKGPGPQPQQSGIALKDGGSAKGGFLSGMKRGSLHREMGVPEDEKIPAKKLEKAEHSDNPKLRKRAILAQTMKSWKHGKN